MIYVVSGFQRSGTSMMMRALTEGGMSPAMSADKNARMDRKYGAGVNSDGYFELELEDFYSDAFPGNCDDKMIKCLYGGVLYLPPPHEYRVVFMRRRAEQIEKSMLKSFGYRHTLTDDNKTFQKEMSRICSCLRDRKSVKSVTEVWMNEVIRHPEREFARISVDGWPISVKRSAKVPDGNKMRFK